MMKPIQAAFLAVLTLGLGIASMEGAEPADGTISLRIVADVDGSDRLIISEQETLWVHRHWAWPTRVTINDAGWNPQGSPTLAEKVHRSLLNEPVDFASARMTVHQGRDTAALETFDDHIVIHLVDSPNGRSTYDVTVTFDLRDAPPQSSSDLPGDNSQASPGLIGMATIENKATGVAFHYNNGKVLAPSLLDHADLPSDGIQIDFRGELRLPKELTVRVRHAGGSSNRGYATLSLDGKVIETLGDDRKKVSEHVLELAGGSHAIRWQIEGGDIGHCLLEFADAANGNRLPLVHDPGMFQELGGNAQTRMVEVDSQKIGWPIPHGW
ncbi:hypothetical protein [Bremerella sp. P1]|uniref:hypothetical protein n=1 Tax=Bremerella sp. P1 TaxID=3026424 RepID=UPI002368D259|nr:hypothetical protein [Bremerella sp. P1]WDI42612.1 hypothetical protein PSR63_01460 [Bremerella sp. P1]